MSSSTVSKGLLILGVLVGSAAAVALALGLRVDQLPPWMITVGMYKLAFIAAGGLFVAGAVLGRAARKRASGADVPNDTNVAERLGPGPWEPGDRPVGEADRRERHRRRDEHR